MKATRTEIRTLPKNLFRGEELGWGKRENSAPEDQEEGRQKGVILPT